jgi:hypothetical protein
VAGRNGEALTESMLTDRDDSKSPGTLWIGSNHGASIVKVEPLD